MGPRRGELRPLRVYRSDGIVAEALQTEREVIERGRGRRAGNDCSESAAAVSTAEAGEAAVHFSSKEWEQTFFFSLLLFDDGHFSRKERSVFSTRPSSLPSFLSSPSSASRPRPHQAPCQTEGEREETRKEREKRRREEEEALETRIERSDGPVLVPCRPTRSSPSTAGGRARRAARPSPPSSSRTRTRTTWRGCTTGGAPTPSGGGDRRGAGILGRGRTPTPTFRRRRSSAPPRRRRPRGHGPPQAGSEVPDGFSGGPGADLEEGEEQQRSGK